MTSFAKKLGLGLVLGLSSMLVACQKGAPGTGSSEKIVFGIQPNEAKRDFAPLKKEILARTGLQIEFRNAKNYEDLIDQMSSGKVDFGFLSPLNFVEIEKKGGVKVLLKKVYGTSEFYFSSLVTKAESPLKSLIALRGKKIAFVDPNSASGYLYPKLMLHNQGLVESAYESVFAGTHEEALKLLAESKVDAAAVWADDAKATGGAWTPMLAKGELKLVPRVLAVSAPIPNDAFVARESFYNDAPDRVLKFMDALISVSEDTTIMKDVFGADRLVTATSRHYESVRELDNLLNTEKK